MISTWELCAMAANTVIAASAARSSRVNRLGMANSSAIAPIATPDQMSGIRSATKKGAGVTKASSAMAPA